MDQAPLHTYRHQLRSYVAHAERSVIDGEVRLGRQIKLVAELEQRGWASAAAMTSLRAMWKSHGIQVAMLDKLRGMLADADRHSRTESARRAYGAQGR